MTSTSSYDMISILGPTASGKTNLATQLACSLHTHILSADSRQVYRGMDLGTGKDLGEYTIGTHSIPYHLIDIAAPGEKYNIYRYQQDFMQIYQQLHIQGLVPILCGGSGLYAEAVLRGYALHNVPEDAALRSELADQDLSTLIQRLQACDMPLHNTTDTTSRQRVIRALEIARYNQAHPTQQSQLPRIRSINFCLNIERDLRRKRISHRLSERLEQGMIAEVEGLLATGLQPEQLLYYGLEYKYLTLYVIGQLSYEEMFTQLEIAIHQFAKRQMTWFRGMERRGIHLHWLDASNTPQQNIAQIRDII